MMHPQNQGESIPSLKEFGADKFDIIKVFARIPTLVTIADFGGWTKVQARHFADGGVFDKIYLPQ